VQYYYRIKYLSFGGVILGKFFKKPIVIIGIIVVVVAIVGGVMAYQNHQTNLDGEWVVVRKDGKETLSKPLGIINFKDGKYHTNISYDGNVRGSYISTNTNQGNYKYNKGKGIISIGTISGTYNLSSDHQTITMTMGKGNSTFYYFKMFENQTVVMVRKATFDKENNY
jgi:uncharacterized protein YxeA